MCRTKPCTLTSAYHLSKAACRFGPMTWPYQAAFSYEPVGPRAFPLLMLALMATALVYMIFRPSPVVHSEDDPQLDRQTLTKIGLCVVLLLVFAGTFEPLGFILSSILVGIPMARLYGGRWLPSIVIISLMSVGLVARNGQ